MQLQMSLSPLKLHKYFFPIFDIQYTVKKEEGVDLSFPLDVNLTVGINKAASGDAYEVYARFMTKSGNNNIENKYPFKFDICVLGLFSLVDKTIEVTEEVKVDIQNMALPVLLGAMRERLASATASYPTGVIVLPIFSITCANDAPRIVEVKSSKGKRKKKGQDTASN